MFPSLVQLERQIYQFGYKIDAIDWLDSNVIPMDTKKFEFWSKNLGHVTNGFLRKIDFTKLKL